MSKIGKFFHNPTLFFYDFCAKRLDIKTYSQQLREREREREREKKIEKLAYKYRNEEEISKGNRFFVISTDGTKREVNEFKNITIITTGNNSLIEINEDIEIKNKLHIIIHNNCYLYIGKSNRIDSLRINMNTDNCTCIIKNNNHIRQCTIVTGEPDVEFIMGNNCLFSIGINIRCSDAHTVISSEDITKIINKPSFGVHIGDHVWLGQGVGIIKNSFIANNCIIGFGSIVAGKFFEQNCAIAGNPAKIIKRNISWSEIPIYKYEMRLKNNIPI